MSGGNGLHERLQAATGERTYRELAMLTASHAETVRRYMQGQAPSAEFLAAVCGALGISGDWLLTGRGPMRSSEVNEHALREATAADLLTAMSSSMERLMDRVDRVELFVQGVDVRLRGVQEGSGDERAEPTERVRSIADAIAKRPSPASD